jgi:hypothetical protein
MRKSRQPRCIAAISGTVAFKTPKLLDADWNFSQAIFSRVTAGVPPRVAKRPWMAGS